jgi:hypothetical protein
LKEERWLLQARKVVEVKATNRKRKEEMDRELIETRPRMEQLTLNMQ